MFQPLAKVPPVTRDLAIVVEEAVPHAEIASAIRAAGGPLVQAVTLFDCYRGSQIPAGKKGLAYTVAYGAGDRTLTDAEVTAAHSAILNTLQTQLRATIR
jgi:phenylalanyl-tRNA synthetase beta chain